jgi:hypothetical protein
MVFPLEEVGYCKHHLKVPSFRDKPFDKIEMGDYHNSFTDDSSLLRSDTVYLGENVVTVYLSNHASHFRRSEKFQLKSCYIIQAAVSSKLM